jgi:hypothetical protein
MEAAETTELQETQPEAPVLEQTPETDTTEEADKPKKKNGYVSVDKRDSPLRKAVREGQNKSLRELIESFGTDGAFMIKVERTHPDNSFDVASGRTFDTLGFCGKFENKPIDEDYIEKQYGGGVYAVKFHEKNPGGSGWKYAAQLTIKIPGDPNLAPYRQKAGLTATGTQPATNPNENPSIVKEAMGMVAKQLESAELRAASAGNNDQVIALMREQLAAARQESAELRAEIRQLANKPPAPAAPARSAIEDQMFSALLSGDSARNTQLVATHASEIRTLKESAAEDLKRQEQRFDNRLADLKAAHEREILAMKQSHEIALAAAKQSHEVQQASSKASHELSQSVLKSENSRLEKENDRLLAEVKELRAKKDLSPIEMLKQVEVLKNALGAGDEEETSTVGKVVEAVTNPGFFEGVATVINQVKTQTAAPQQQQAEQQQALAQQKKPQIVKHNGEKYALMPDGTLKGPLRKKTPAEKTAEGGGEEGKPAEPQMPTIEPGQLAMTIQFLDSACSGGQDPEVVAQGMRSRGPDELMAAIREHGVDAVISKMAKLPSSSILSSIAGRNWLRKLGTALVGE